MCDAQQKKPKSFGFYQLDDETCSWLKLVCAIFYQIFSFSPNDKPSKTMKNVPHFI